MDRLLARLDRRLGRYAIEGLPIFIAVGMGLVLLLSYTRPDLLSLLALSPRLVAHGQVWRLVTYLFLPDDGAVSIWSLFNIYWVWMLGSALEAEWGAFKLNAYYFLGMLGTTAAAFIVGRAEGNFYLNLSLLLALATLFPDFEIRWFFLIAIPMKWIGWLAAAYLVYEMATGGWAARAAIIAASSNYLFFFWGDLTRMLRGLGGGGRARRGGGGGGGGGALGGLGARRVSSAPSPGPAVAVASRACVTCGATEAGGADIRVCSCEKCKTATGGQPRTFCLEHARNH